MKRGFCTESHVVVYCDICGDIYTDAEGKPTCFTTTSQAAEFLTTDTHSGWLYDGDTIRCDGCIAAEQCRDHGHVLVTNDLWAELVTGPLVCCVCGLLESDLPELEK
ncbi:hypothetical protein ACFWM1_28495 [Nocardia sp. NPDC058379]|uniref:hypothetical protein n=1 Tax=unclassified Nocardia TaxID=2637762 RepID=UPI003667FEFC